MSEPGFRLTLERDREKRIVVVPALEGVAVGMEVRCGGQAVGSYKITRIEPTEVIARIPREVS